MSDRHIHFFAAAALVAAALACNLNRGPTAEPPASSAPSAVPANPSPPGSSAGGACDNSLFPVVVGATWTYTTNIAIVGEFTRTVSTVRADGFTDQDVFSSGITRTSEWKCENGALTDLQPGGGPSGAVQSENITAEFQTTAMSGVTLPAAVHAGDAWTQSFTLEGNESINGQDIPAKNETTNSCTAGGTESVTVPAGTFEAVRLDCTGDINITVTINGVEVPTNVSTASTMWYAPGVGMVKTDTVISSTETDTLELTAYDIP